MALHYGIGAHRNEDETGVEPRDVRKDLEALLTGVGVLPGGPTPLVVGTSGWAYEVQGPVWWVTQRAAGDGLQLWGNDGAVVVGEDGVDDTVPTAPGAGLERIDIVWIRHPSNGENGDASSEPEIGVAVGTPGSPAVPPAIPAGALELARNTMTSAATSTASAGNAIVQTAPRAGIATPPPERQVFTASGTWTKPAGARRVRVTVVGGGGGGGGATSGAGQSEGSAGGGGGTAIKWFDADDLSPTEAVTVGAGGSGVSAANGTAGGDSVFHGVTGGGGGNGRVMNNTATNGASLGGSGGTASGGDVNVPGGSGCNGRVIGGQGVLTGQSGASLLATGVGQPTAQGPGNPGSGYGCGGGGAFAANAAQAGGAGAPGVVIVETWW